MERGTMVLLGWPVGSPANICNMPHTTCKLPCERLSNRSGPCDSLAFYAAPNAQPWYCDGLPAITVPHGPSGPVIMSSLPWLKVSVSLDITYFYLLKNTGG